MMQIGDYTVAIQPPPTRTRRRLRPYTPLHETALAAPLPKRTARVVVIRAQRGNARDANVYDDNLLRRSYAAFEGARVTVDHDTEAERSQRPEGSLRDQAGWLTGCMYERGPDGV